MICQFKTPAAVSQPCMNSETKLFYLTFAFLLLRRILTLKENKKKQCKKFENYTNKTVLKCWKVLLRVLKNNED